jgi:UDP-glucuronate decarboxylase
MTILVTGGAGFLGSNLCKELVKNTDDLIIACDNLTTGKIENLKELLECPNFSFIEQDITQLIDIKVDQIYNAACPASPCAYQKNPIDTLKTCFIGTLNMLELAKKYNATLLQFSTSEIYGDPQIHPQVEEYWGNVNPIGIRSCYDEGKRVAETLCMDYNRYYNTKIKIVRIFNTYGENMSADDGRVISNFITQALNNKNITIYGDGKQTRSFCYVSDLIEGLILMMNSSDDITGPYNLGNPQEYTILEVAKKIIELTKSKSKIVYMPLPNDDPSVRQPDIFYVQRKLNWTPKISFIDGLKKTIDFYKNL